MRKLGIMILAGVLALMACPSPTGGPEPPADTSAADVAAAKAALAIGYVAGDAAGWVTANLTLPLTAANGVAVTWASSLPSVVSTSGVVTRPVAGQADAAVSLTATLTKNSASDTKTFNLTVRALGAVDTSAADVATAKTSLEIEYAAGDSAAWVTVNLTLPATATNSVAVTWASNLPSVISATGVVTRPAAGQADAAVTMTATLTKNAASDTKTYVLSVKALGAAPSYAAQVWDGQWRALDLTFPDGTAAFALCDGAWIVQLSDRTFRQWGGAWTTTLTEAPAVFTSLCWFDTSLWGTATDGKLYRWTGVWSEAAAPPSPARSLAIWGTSLAALGTDGGLYVLDGLWRSSAPTLPTGAKAIVSFNGTLYVLTSAPALYRLDGDWILDGRTIPANGAALVAADANVYLITQ